MSEPTELRKCPFCSSPPVIEKSLAQRWLFWYVCRGCKSGPRLGEYTLEEAAKSWNNQTEVIRLELDIVGLKAEKRALELQMHDLKDKLSKFESIN